MSNFCSLDDIFNLLHLSPLNFSTDAPSDLAVLSKIPNKKEALKALVYSSCFLNWGVGCIRLSASSSLLIVNVVRVAES